MTDRERQRAGRPPVGTVIRIKKGPNAGLLQGIVVLVDGTKQRLPPFPAGTTEAYARQRTLAKQEQVRAAGVRGKPPSGSGGGATPAHGTVAAWFSTFVADREARGLTSAHDDRGRFTNHIEPVLGALAMATLTRADIERLVLALDTKVRAGELSWKTASNIWVLTTKMFSESVRSKVPGLRAREDNPCRDVAPPDRGIRKAKSYLFPSELLRLLECPDVTLRWRRAVAVSVYLGLRAGELDALRWPDVDLEHGVVHVHQAVDRSRAGELKTTKSGVSRRFRIEPALVPLLVAMHAEAGGKGLVCEPISEGTRSMRLRRFLWRAGVRRSELHVESSDQTRKRLGWHDLRATCATWAAVRGDEPLKIMHRLGHRQVGTTMLYVREAEQLREGFGTPFPPLPAALLGGATPGSFDQLLITRELSVGKNWVTDGDRTRDSRSHSPALCH